MIAATAVATAVATICNVNTARRTWTDEQRDEALLLYADHGVAVAAERTGIPRGTIASWARRAGVAGGVGINSEAVQARSAMRRASALDRRTDIAAGLLDDVARLRAELFAPVVHRKVVTVNDGPTHGSHVEIVDVELDSPIPTDKKALMTTIAIAVDKALLLLGEATERVEQLGGSSHNDIENRRTTAAGALDELAQRRAS